MLYIKFISIMLIIIFTAKIGYSKSRKYKDRVFELKEMKEALNIFKTKITFTYETIPTIFEDISNLTYTNISKIFKGFVENIKSKNAKDAWNMAIKSVNTCLKEEDIKVISSLGNLLGKTDKNGQISEIELVQEFIDAQIVIAETEREKNEKLYKTLGTISGIALGIMLI